jgi:hemerythrin-like domain-containing protein
MEKTTSASKIRTELLEQHGEIRARADEVRAAMDELKMGPAARDVLRGALARLADAVRNHNAREEELLEDVIPHVDAWGPARAEVMVESHGEEQQEIYAALVEAGANPDSDAAIRVVTELLDRMKERMAVEEKLLLGEDVLHDDLVPREYFGG